MPYRCIYSLVEILVKARQESNRFVAGAGSTDLHLTPVRVEVPLTAEAAKAAGSSSTTAGGSSTSSSSSSALGSNGGVAEGKSQGPGSGSSSKARAQKRATSSSSSGDGGSSNSSSMAKLVGISAAKFHSCAVSEEGVLYTW